MALSLLNGSNVSSCVVLFLFSWVGLVGRPRAGARRVGSPAGARRKDPPGRVSSTPRLRCLRRPLFDRQTSNSPLGVKGSTAQSGRAVRRGDLIGPPRRPAGEPAACVRLLVLIFFFFPFFLFFFFSFFVFTTRRLRRRRRRFVKKTCCIAIAFLFVGGPFLFCIYSSYFFSF